MEGSARLATDQGRSVRHVVNCLQNKEIVSTAVTGQPLTAKTLKPSDLVSLVLMTFKPSEEAMKQRVNVRCETQ